LHNYPSLKSDGNEFAGYFYLHCHRALDDG
jgi:hypothetical protein